MPRSMGRLELQEVTVALAARAQVIEPFVCFGDRHGARSDLLEKLPVRTPVTIRVRIFLKQASIEYVEDAFFFSLEMTLRAQTCPPV